MKKFIALLAAGSLLFTLSACSHNEPEKKKAEVTKIVKAKPKKPSLTKEYDGTEVKSIKMKTIDGRTVYCVGVLMGSASTLSCDWEHAK